MDSNLNNELKLIDFFNIIKLDKPYSKLSISNLLEVNIESIEEYEKSLIENFNVKLEYDNINNRYNLIDEGDFNLTNITSVLTCEDINMIIYTLINSKNIMPSKMHIIKSKLITFVSTEEKERLDKIIIDHKFKSSSDNSIETIKIILDGINTKKMLEFYYISSEQEVIKKYKITPHSFSYESGIYYLLGKPSDEAINHFRVDKIRKIQLLEESGEILNFKDITSYLNKTWYMHRGEETKVQVKFDKSVFEEVIRIPYEGKMIENEEDNNYFIYEFLSNGIDGIFIWLMGFGEYALILEPKELKERIRLSVNRMSTIYNERK